MEPLIDGPVGIRWRSAQVRNTVRDQQTITELLARIKENEGGMAHLWDTRPLPGSDGKCLPALADAIGRFQKHWVAKKTLSTADSVVDPRGPSERLMNKLAFGAPGKGGGVVDDGIVKVDVVLALIPMDHRASIKNDAQRRDYIKQRVIPPGYDTQRRRLELFIDYPSSHFDCLRQLRDIKLAIGPHASIGKLCLIGISLGGLNIIRLAQNAGMLRAPVSIVGLVDTAFFHDDAVSPPSAFSNGPVAPIMKAKYSNFNAQRKIDTFQHSGNITMLTRALKLVWWSAMVDGEIHGAIEGMHRHYDVTARVQTKEPNKAHREGAELGEDMVYAEFRQVLMNV